MTEERTLPFPHVLSQDAVAPRHASGEKALTELYEQARPALVGYVYLLLGRACDAEDVVQMAFLKLHDQLTRDAPVANLRSWVYRVVHNLAIDLARRQLRHDSHAPDLLALWQAAATASAEDDLIRQQEIARSLQRLNERERHCLLLRAEGLSYKEIGEVLAISPKAVSVYLVRGLKKFERQR